MLCLGSPKPTEKSDPCVPNPCGPNASPSSSGSRCICTCNPEYFGDPFTGCKPECVYNDDCPSNRACVRNKCVDPCIGVCGQNAECRVTNHNPICSCIQNYIGDPFVRCDPRKYNIIIDARLTFPFQLVITIIRLSILYLTLPPKSFNSCIFASINQTFNSAVFKISYFVAILMKLCFCQNSIGFYSIFACSL